MKTHTPQNGFIALMSAMLISVALLTLMISVSFEGYYGRFAILDSELKETSVSLAEACVNIAILRLAQGNEFTGTVPVGDNECEIVDINTVSGNYVIEAQGVYKDAYTNLEVEIDPDFFPETHIVSWVEVPNF